MSYLNFLPNAASQTQQTISFGMVDPRMPAPTSFDDPLYVIQPDWSSDYFFIINGWPAIHGVTLPAQGAEVLMIKDPRMNWRVVWWDGSYTSESLTHMLAIEQSVTVEHVSVTVH